MKKTVQTVTLLLLLVTTLYAFSPLKYQRLVIFWNPVMAIDPAGVPANYKRPEPFDGLEYVGQYSDSKPYHELCKAPEIGKSALKMFLTALDSTVGYTYGKTLDTTGIKERVEDNSGVVTGASPAVLPRVRIYSVYDDIRLDSLYNAFDGEGPEAIVILNAGAKITADSLSRMAITTLLYDASMDDINLLFIGSASTPYITALNRVCENKGTDPLIPIREMDKSYVLSPYSGSLLFDYNFCSDSNANGSEQDSVVFGYENNRHTIHKVSSVVFNNGSYTYVKGDLLYEAEGSSVSVDKLLIAAENITHHWGQFRIEGIKASLPIVYDGDQPDMNSALFYDTKTLAITPDKKLIVTADLTADYIHNYAGNSIAAGDPIVEAGTALPIGEMISVAVIKKAEEDSQLGSSQEYQKSSKISFPGACAPYNGAWIADMGSDKVWIFSPAKGDGTQSEDVTQFRRPAGGSQYEMVTIGNDNIKHSYSLIMGDTVVIWSQNDKWEKKDSIGYFVVDSIYERHSSYQFEFTDDFIINNARVFREGSRLEFRDGYEISFPKSGYSNLSMDMGDIAGNGNSEIFDKVFELSALDEHATIPFKTWEDNGRISCDAEIWGYDEHLELARYSDWLGPQGAFDRDKYYVATFCQQVAKGEKQFYTLEENVGKNGFEKHYFNQLPDESQSAIKNKEYPLITVGRKGHFQFALLGYQPHFLEDVALSMDILRDITSHVAHGGYSAPYPQVYLKKDGQLYSDSVPVPTTIDELAIVVDLHELGQDIYDEGYTLFFDLQYPYGNTISALTLDDVKEKKSAKDSLIDTLIFDLADVIDPTISTNTTLRTFMVDFNLNANLGGFVSSPPSYLFTFPKLIAEFTDNSTEFIVSKDVAVQSTHYALEYDTTTYTLPGGVPQIVMNGESSSSPMNITIDKSQTVTAYAEMEGYVRSDTISRDYTKEMVTFPVPLTSVPEDSILFVTDSVGVELILSGEMLESKIPYTIEWAITYNGEVALAGTSEKNSAVNIALSQFIKRDNCEATQFTLKAKTVSGDASSALNSVDTVYSFSVRKLNTDPSAAASVDFTGTTFLPIEALYGGSEVADADILYRYGSTINSMKSGESTVDFTTSVSLTFWAEDSAYINSDTVSDYRLNLVDVVIPTLPTPLVTPLAENVNGNGEYIFATENPFHLALSSYEVNGKSVSNDDYSLAYTLGSATLSQSDTGFIVLQSNFVDSLCINGFTSVTLQAQALSTDFAQWNSSATSVVQTYDFRQVQVDIEEITEESDTTVVRVHATDPVTEGALEGAVIYYTFDGTTPDKSSAKIDAGKGIRVPLGSILKVVADCRNYINGSGQAIFTKEAFIMSDPVTGSFFGESLEVALTSNFSPIYYTIDGGDTLTIETNSGAFTLDDNLPSLIRDNDTVKIHVWVNAVTNGGVTMEGTSAEYHFYRRKLPKVVVSPESGMYNTSSIEVTMVTPGNVGAIHYALNGVDLDAPTTPYTTPFSLTLDEEVTARAYAVDWLPSDTTTVHYRYLNPDTLIITADINKDGTVDVKDFAEVSSFWYNSAKNEGSFTELAPDFGDFGKPDIRPDNRFDFEDLNRFVQYCYWFVEQGYSSKRSQCRTNSLAPISCRAQRRDSTIELALSAEGVEDLVALSCELVESKETSWKSGPFLSGEGKPLSAVLGDAFVQSRLSQTAPSVSGSGLLAEAKLPKEQSADTLLLWVTLVYQSGVVEESLMRVPVESDNSVTLSITPTPLLAGDEALIHLRSQGAPCLSYRIQIYDITAQLVYEHEASLIEPQNSVAVQYSGETNWRKLLASGSYAVECSYELDDGTNGRVSTVMAISE